MYVCFTENRGHSQYKYLVLWKQILIKPFSHVIIYPQEVWQFLIYNKVVYGLMCISSCNRKLLFSHERFIKTPELTRNLPNFSSRRFTL